MLSDLAKLLLFLFNFLCHFLDHLSLNFFFLLLNYSLIPILYRFMIDQQLLRSTVDQRFSRTQFRDLLLSLLFQKIELCRLPFLVLLLSGCEFTEIMADDLSMFKSTQCVFEFLSQGLIGNELVLQFCCLCLDVEYSIIFLRIFNQVMALCLILQICIDLLGGVGQFELAFICTLVVTFLIIIINLFLIYFSLELKQFQLSLILVERMMYLLLERRLRLCFQQSINFPI